MLKLLAAGVHRVLARAPFLARPYFALLPTLSSVLPALRRQQWVNSLQSTDWRAFEFAPREIEVADGTRFS